MGIRGIVGFAPRWVFVALIVGLFLAAPAVAAAQTVPSIKNPRLVEFTVSPDHAVIDSYELGFFMPGAALPFTIVNIGKPAPDATGTASAPINVQPFTFAADYTAKLRAVVGTATSDWSAPSNPFDRVPGAPSKLVAK